MLPAFAFSFCFHWFLDWVARQITMKKLIYVYLKADSKIEGNDFTWRNSVISLSHAIVTGFGALLSFYLTPGLSNDLIDTSSGFTINLVSYSIGYFFMDIIHMYRSAKTRATYELIVHHILIISCFSSALFSGKFIGYAVVALLIEVNSVFLHLRRIAKYLNIPKESYLLRTICFANVGTFIVFRFMVLSWMTRWLVVNRDRIAMGYYCLGAIGLAVIMVMNIVLFLRVVTADFRCNSSAAASLVASASSNSTSGKSIPVCPPRVHTSEQVTSDNSMRPIQR